MIGGQLRTKSDPKALIQLVKKQSQDPDLTPIFTGGFESSGNLGKELGDALNSMQVGTDKRGITFSFSDTRIMPELSALIGYLDEHPEGFPPFTNNFSYTVRNTTVNELIKHALAQLNSKNLDGYFLGGNEGGDMAGILGGTLEQIQPGKIKNTIECYSYSPALSALLTIWLSYWDDSFLKKKQS